MDLDTAPGARGVMCDACGADAAVLAAHYPGIRARPPRWCASCGGRRLAELVDDGQVVTVTAVPTPAAGDVIELDGEVGVTTLPWTAELATEVLRYARPPGVAFARALVDAGGAATAAQLREATGLAALNHATGTLNAAVRTVAGRRRLRFEDRHLAKPLPPPDDPRRKVVHSYELPAVLVPVLDDALTALGWPQGSARAAAGHRET